jgi:hypothetical protein
MSESLEDYTDYLVPDGQPAGEELVHVSLHEIGNPLVTIPNDDGEGGVLFDLHTMPRHLNSWDLVYNNDMTQIAQWLFTLYTNVDNIASVMGGGFNEIPAAQTPAEINPDENNEIEDIDGNTPVNVQIGTLQGQIGSREFDPKAGNPLAPSVPNYPADWDTTETGGGWNWGTKKSLTSLATPGPASLATSMGQTSLRIGLSKTASGTSLTSLMTMLRQQRLMMMFCFIQYEITLSA